MTELYRIVRVPMAEHPETVAMARNIGNAIAAGRLLNPYRLWVLDPATLPRRRHWKAKLSDAHKALGRLRREAIRKARGSGVAT